ncbi:MAG: IS4/Tn5 family transposase DNA-binding protein, partial [Pseudomonadota bacterium]
MGQNWVETETAGCDLGDARLNRRLEAMPEALGGRPGKSRPTAFQDWSNTKAAYPLLFQWECQRGQDPRGPFRRLCPPHPGNRWSHSDLAGHDGVFLQARRAGEGRVHKDFDRTKTEGGPPSETCGLRAPDAC